MPRLLLRNSNISLGKLNFRRVLQPEAFWLTLDGAGYAAAFIADASDDDASDDLGFIAFGLTQ